MNSFIHHIARYLLEEHENSLSELVVVFPNRRAGLYLRKSLSELIEKPVIMPQVLSIEDFVFKVTNFKPIDPVYLQFELFKVYQSQNKAKSQPFSEFLHWGEVVLKEFNELDLAMADHVQLFDYLSETKAISLWNPDQTPLTAFQQNYLQFYKSLGTLYAKLRTVLIEKRRPYQGLAYRLLVEKWQNEGVNLPWDKVIMAGFNALTNAEEKLFLKLEETQKGIFFWDWDNYYAEDKLHEAGRFVRQNRKTFKTFNNPDNPDHFKDVPKDIEIIGVPKRIGQAGIAGAILTKLSNETEISTNTAVVLNDEELTIPLLIALPPDIGSFNVTMGLPLIQTPAARLIGKVIDLQINALKMKRKSSNSVRFYYKDVLALLENPIFQKLLEVGDVQLTDSVEDLRKSNAVFIEPGQLFTTRKTDLFNQDDQQLSLLISDWQNNPTVAVKSLKMLVQKLKDFLNIPADKNFDHKLNLEYLFHISKALNSLEGIVGEYKFVHDLKTFQMVFMQVMKTLRLPFYGEPLQGIQVMGMLESRSLDFENIILTSVNEGHLPAGKTGNSFIPLDIKKTFGIPIYEEQNAVVAYHFYRLLQRAKKVYILYNTEPDDLGGGDKSRFVMQLLNELKLKSPDSKISERVINLSAGMETIDEPIVVAKDQAIIQRLHEMAKSGFSASSLNSYRKCSLQFYFRFVESIHEKNDPEETIEADTFGTVVHEVLSNLYKPYIELPLSVSAIINMKKAATKFLQHSFEKNYPGGDNSHGKNLLIYKVAETYIQNFLDQEINTLKPQQNGAVNAVKIVGLEKYFESEVNLTIPVKLIGFFDRIDVFNEKIRIIDYKTGRVEPKDLKFNNWDILATDSDLEKSFQLLFYKYLYLKLNPGNEPESGIISLRNLSSGFMGVDDPQKQKEENKNKAFEDVLVQLFADIFDPEQPFTQTSDDKVCKYCPFNNLCNRN